MTREAIITGLDIGSSSIRIVVGQKNPQDSKLHILGAVDHPSDGINKGVITSIEDAVSSISVALEKVERMTGIPIEHAYVSMGGSHITAQDSHGVVAVAKADGEIREDDVDRAIEAAQTVASPPNYEILHVIPRSFIVDNQRGIKDPIGMTGIRLEVDAQIILGLSAQIKNLTKCVYRTSVDIDDLVLGVLASAECILTKRQKELGLGLLNIGGSTTSLLVFEEGDVIHTAILPIGANHITNDLAIGLRTSIDIAEKVKTDYGSALPEEIHKREEIDLQEFSPQETGRISRKHIAEIIEARLEEIFELANQELGKIKRSGLLPAGMILTGGGAKLHGIVEKAKMVFKLPSQVGLPQDVVTAIDKIYDPGFTTGIGLVVWGSYEKPKSSRISLQSFSSVAEVTGKMKKWFQSLIP